MYKMQKTLLLSFYMLFAFVTASTFAQRCTPVTPNIDPSELPKFNNQFQTRIEISSIETNSVVEAYVKYDYDDRAAQITYQRKNTTFSETFFYKQDEILYRPGDGICLVKKLSEEPSDLFFGFEQASFGPNIKPPTYFLFFNNGVPTRKMDGTTLRGVPVNHYQSCQQWTKPRKATVLVDYYFKVRDVESAVEIPELSQYKEVPFSFVVNGVTDDGSPIAREYNFFDFKNIIERAEDLYGLREGEYCDGQTDKEPLPKIPSSFSFLEQSVIPGFSTVSQAKIFYSYELKAFREDPFHGYTQGQNTLTKDPVKIIHDFHNGAAFVINKLRKNCSISSLTDTFSSRIDAVSSGSNFTRIKTPEEYFNINDNYFYAGERYERGKIADVFVSKTTNKFGNVTLTIVNELFLNKIIPPTDEGLDQLEPVAPITLRYYRPGDIIITGNLFDFDSKLKRDDYDISQCFNEKDKNYFAIRFNYPQEISEQNFTRQFGQSVLEQFEREILKSTSIYNASPLRIIPPTIQTFERNFVIYAGLTNSPEAIYHFSKSPDSKINLDRIKRSIPSNSANNCASKCLTDSAFAQDTDYMCYSFDFCQTSSGGICSFYNYSLTTDPDVSLEGNVQCDHYAKITQDYDAADVGALFRLVEEAVLRKQFNLTINARSIGDGKETTITFTGNEIYPARPGGQDDGVSTSFFSRFILIFGSIDFNKTNVLERKNVILRERKDVSVDECARSCLNEAAFVCELMTYSKIFRECKWASLPNIYEVIDSDFATAIIPAETYELFIRDPVYNYLKYPFKVTSLVSNAQEDVRTETECALKCSYSKSMTCRSFNFCKVKQDQFRCILSDTNIHSIDKDPNVVDSVDCDHFSRLAIGDFQVVYRTQMGLKPQSSIGNLSVESCAELCALEDAYLCRSFDFIAPTRTCNLFKENVKDKIYFNLNLQQNPDCNHYSRLYYEENGVLKKIEALRKSSSGKHGAGTVIGILICCIVGGILLGVMFTFIYFKLTTKSTMLPVMSFKNPGFSEENKEPTVNI